MPKQTRQRTAYNGIYFVELADGDQSFFIRYKKNGKSFEERAGRSSQGCNAEKASFLRKERLSGENQLSNYSWKSTGQLDEENKWTFSVIFEAYLRLRPDLKGRENDIYRFKNYLKKDFGDIIPSDVVPHDIERFRHKLQNQQLKPATVKHVLELLRRLANYAFKKKFCPGLSFKIQMPIVENQKTENLTHMQLEKLLKVLDEEPDETVSNIVRLVLYSGLRRGEIFGLKWNDIDFYGKTINIRSKKKEKHVVIPLNEMAEKVLAEHAKSEVKSEFVFPSRGGKKRTECKRTLFRIKKNADLPDDFRLLQGLRHVYASMLASSGEVDMETLQKLLTHKSPLMTQRYAHLRENALRSSNEKLEQDQISTSHNTLKEKPTTYDDVRIVQDQKESFEKDFSEVAEDDQTSKINDQRGGDDHTFEINEKNEYLKVGLKEIEAEFKEQETEYSEVDVEPIKIEVDMDEIVSAEELAEATVDSQNTEFNDQRGDDDHRFETNEENKYVEVGLKVIEKEFKEQETEYSEVDVEPIKMEVDMDEIVSAEELSELDNGIQVDETNAVNKGSRIFEELNSETLESVENMESEYSEVDYQDLSELDVLQDCSEENETKSYLEEEFFTETEAQELITGVSWKKVESFKDEEYPEGENFEVVKDVQTKNEKVNHQNYCENEENMNIEESVEEIGDYEGKFSSTDDVIKIKDFTLENNNCDHPDSGQQEYKVVESEADEKLIQATGIDNSNISKEKADFIGEMEKEKINSNINEINFDALSMEDCKGVQDYVSHDGGQEIKDKIKSISTNIEDSVYISRNKEGFNMHKDKSDNNSITSTVSDQDSENLNSLKNVKIDFESKPENEEFAISSDNYSRSSISELKKELMSLSDLIKSTPNKLKSSVEVKNP